MVGDGVDSMSDAVLQDVDGSGDDNDDVDGIVMAGTRRSGITAAIGCDDCVVVFKAGAYASCSIT